MPMNRSVPSPQQHGSHDLGSLESRDMLSTAKPIPGQGFSTSLAELKDSSHFLSSCFGFTLTTYLWKWERVLTPTYSMQQSGLCGEDGLLSSL